ncbi:MAG: ATP-binding cassette domain-containing protein, partial [Deltaproteobacteria bacterium]|nr:ATP-binding cassette domain-containing protein [Deltaproteobacteria bacterium]
RAGSLGVFLEGVAGGRWRAEELLSLFVCLVLMYQPLKGLTRAQGLWAGARAAWDDLAPWLAPPARASRGEGGGGLAGGAEGAPPPLALLGGALARGGRVVARVSPGELRAGRITLVAGPNGVGKSTLLARLAGLNPPPPGEAPAAGCAWLGQGPGDPLDLLSLAGLSVADVFGRLAASEGRAPWPLAPAAVFEALGLPPAWLDARAPRASLDALSGGERRKLSLALALCLQRPLLLLDEPESHLDARSIEGLRALLIALAASGRCAVLVATHDARLAELATHALHLTPPTHDAPPMTLLP